MRSLFAVVASRLDSRDESGAYAVMFAVLTVVIMGMAALAIDIGDVRQTRVGLVTATDAAALAAAQTFSTSADGCGAVDDDYVARNDPDAAVTGCVHIPATSTSGRVSVAASTEVSHAFASVFGFDSTNVAAESEAYYGQPSGLKGLRPFGLCGASSEFLTWIAAGRPVPSPIYTITYDKDQPSACGDTVPGNWGLIDFNGGANSNQETRDWVSNGYPGTVFAPAWYEGDPGSFSNSLPLPDLLNQQFHVPVFDAWNENPGGNAEFHIVGMLGVTLHGFKANGRERNRYLELSFNTGVVPGPCCGTGVDTGLRVVQLCRFESNESDCTP
ncbi:MAG: hypothetical protein ACI8Y4_003937 [Candidatus Poriferisodalaceae bacterium]|jgi:hypothetical protein